MISTPIRYRFAVLLLWAALALVANPVLHAFSHDHFDHPEDDKESIADMQWSEQDFCPYCEAVSHFIESPVTQVTQVPVVAQWNSESVAILYLDLRLRLPIRLRAPPFIA